MPINKDKSYQLGFSASIELVETIDDLCSRIGVSKSQFIRKACQEMVWKLLHEQKVSST
jgi:metal-responsive CopG/Arc/MetJ family transcriptional regulator